MEFGLWSYEIIWKKKKTLIWFWKRRPRSKKLRIANLKFEPFSVTLKFEPYIECFGEGLEDKSQNQKLQTLEFGCNKKFGNWSWRLEREMTNPNF
jgi:hypothetical protein